MTTTEIVFFSLVLVFPTVFFRVAVSRFLIGRRCTLPTGMEAVRRAEQDVYGIMAVSWVALWGATVAGLSILSWLLLIYLSAFTIGGYEVINNRWKQARDGMA